MGYSWNTFFIRYPHHSLKWKIILTSLSFQVDEQKTTSNNAGKLKPFTFNVVFEPEAKQEDILEHSGIKRLIDMAIEGFSTTCFCYGQTGSGKTHTLTGPPFLVCKP